MLRTIRIALFTLACCGILASAQTTYSIVPGSCPMNDIPTQCVVDLSPANPLGIYPTLTLVDDLSNNATNGGTAGGNSWRFLGFETTQGPTGGYLGDAFVQVNQAIDYGQPGHYRSYPLFAQFCSGSVCITDASALTVYFEGDYIGSGSFTGMLTMHFAYSYGCTLRGGCKWARRVVSGEVRID